MHDIHPNPKDSRMPAFRVFPFIRCAIFALAGLLLLPACEDSTDDSRISDDDLHGRSPLDIVASDPFRTNSVQNAAAPAAASDTSTAKAKDASSSAIADTYNTATEIGAISWKGKNASKVASWPVTTTLNASVSGSTVSLSYDKAKDWPSVDGVCANAWAIVNINGKWYAGTFEYLRSGQTSKPSYTLDGSHGDHFKVSPLSSWRPHSGEVFGLMVSGLCRNGLSNVEERSNICIVRWP